jgi:hypothetical protein
MAFSQISETPEETKARLSGTLEQPTSAEIITQL